MLEPLPGAKLYKVSKSQFHVTLSERSLRTKSLGANGRRFFVARKTLAPQNDKPVIYWNYLISLNWPKGWIAVWKSFYLIWRSLSVFQWIFAIRVRALTKTKPKWPSKLFRQSENFLGNSSEFGTKNETHAGQVGWVVWGKSTAFAYSL